MFHFLFLFLCRTPVDIVILGFKKNRELYADFKNAKLLNLVTKSPPPQKLKLKNKKMGLSKLEHGFLILSFFKGAFSY